eukprot:gene4954-6171_t
MTSYFNNTANNTNSNEIDNGYLEKIFHECDPDGTGFIDKDQLKNTVSRITGKEIEGDELETLMTHLDTDRDGKISLNEFLNGYEIAYNNSFQNDDEYKSPEDYEKHIRFIFSLFDKDGDGLVSIEQLREMLVDIKDKSGVEQQENGEDNDDDDIEYIMKTLNVDGNETISFDQFIRAIEQINSPSHNTPPNEFDEFDNHNNESIDSHHHQSDHELDIDNNNNNNEDNSNHHHHERSESPSVEKQEQKTDKQKRRARGRASSWVAPNSIVNMIKKRTDLFSKEEMEVFDSSDTLADQYKKRADKLKSENEHLGSKLNMFEDQLREARESHDRLSEDNAQLKESIVIGKRTLIENQKLSGTNKKLEEQIESLKKQLSDAVEQKNEIVKLQNKLKSDREQLNNELEARINELSRVENKVKQLEEDAATVAPILKKAQELQAMPLETEQLTEEILSLKIKLQEETTKSQENIKLLTEEYQLLLKQRKEDKALLESSNQIIHKLKLALEEVQINGHISDPNYKASLLSELEQQVVTRLGTPGSLNSESNILPPGSPYEPPQQQSEKRQEAPASPPIAIRQNGKGLVREEKEVDHHDDDITDEHLSPPNSWQEKYKELSGRLEEENLKHTTTMDSLRAKENLLHELNTKIENEKKELESTVEQLKQTINDLNKSIEQQQSTIGDSSSQLPALQDQINQLEVQKKDLQDQLEQSKKELQVASEKEFELQNQLEQSKKELQDQLEKSKKDQELQVELEKSKQELQDQLEKSKNDYILQINNSKSDYQSLQDQFSKSQTDYQQLQQSYQQLQDEHQNIKTQQQVLAKSIQPTAVTSDPISIKAGQTQTELSALKQRIDELAAKNTSLLNENSQLKSSLSPISSPTASTVDLGGVVTLVETSPVSPVSSVTYGGEEDTTNNSKNNSSFKSTQTIEDLQQQISSLNEIKDHLEKDLKKYESLSVVPAVQPPVNTTLLEDMRKEHEKLSEKYRTIEFQNILKDEENKELKNKCQDLEEKAYKMKIEYENKVAQIQVNDKKNKILKENEDLKSRLRKYEQEEHHIDIIELEDETKQLRAKIDDLNSRLSNEKNLNKHLQGQIDSYENSRDMDKTPLINSGTGNNAYHNRRSKKSK